MNQAAALPIGIGHNNPPTDEEQLREYLEDSASDLNQKAKEIEEALARLPAEINDDVWEGKITTFVKQADACAKNFEDLREKNKKPFWDAGKIVDGFFQPKIKSMKTVKESATKIIKNYRKKKREEAAREAAAAAERARKEEEQRLADAAAAEKAAADARAEAERLANADARAEAERLANADAPGAAQAAKEAEKLSETADKKLNSALRMESRGDRFEDLARTGGRAGVTRSDSGAAALDQKKWMAAVEDPAILDLEALRPYLKPEDLQKALNGLKDDYVRRLKDDKDAPVPVVSGARIWLETKTVIR